MMELSACMIVKNEAQNIVRAVENARKVADELIIVDTGSTDKTRQILDSINQPYFTLEWEDSFSLARNFSISKATKPWIFWMDADDDIPDNSAAIINNLKKKKKPDCAYMFTIHSVDTVMKPEIGPDARCMHLRMFPNFMGLGFTGRVHEQVCGKNFKNLKLYHAENIIIEHRGYSDPEHQRQSLHRNIRLQLINMGYPENTDFFSFTMGPHIFCVYYPTLLTIWYKHIYVAMVKPFLDGCPETHDLRFEKIKKAVTDYLRTYAEGMKVSKGMENAPIINDIESAIKDGVFDVCGQS